jgi:hypothetical protein
MMVAFHFECFRLILSHSRTLTAGRLSARTLLVAA